MDPLREGRGSYKGSFRGSFIKGFYKGYLGVGFEVQGLGFRVLGFRVTTTATRIGNYKCYGI